MATPYERALERARRTWVFEHPEHPDQCFVIAHPGQNPNLDAKHLRQFHGIMPQHAHGVKLLSDSTHRPLSDEEKVADRAAQAKKASSTGSSMLTPAETVALRAEIAELRAQMEELLTKPEVAAAAATAKK